MAKLYHRGTSQPRKVSQKHSACMFTTASNSHPPMNISCPLPVPSFLWSALQTSRLRTKHSVLQMQCSEIPRKAALEHTRKEQPWIGPCQAVGCSFGPLLGARAEIRFVVASRGCKIPTVAAGVQGWACWGRTGGKALRESPRPRQPRKSLVWRQIGPSLDSESRMPPFEATSWRILARHP